VTISEREVVAALGQALARRIGEPRYQLWFDGHTKFAWDGDRLTVGVPNRHFEEWLQKAFGTAVAEAAQEVFGQPTAVDFIIDPELFRAARREQETVRGHLPSEARGSRIENRGSRPGTRAPENRDKTPESPSAILHPPSSILHPPSSEILRDPPSPVEEPPRRAKARARRWHRLADFVVGSCNRVAHAAALSVVEEPGEGANPLVLHGPVGTGKTHLLEGIYAGLRRTHPDWRVCYVTAEDFTNRFVQALRLGKLTSFRKQFREVDALLLDDLHFLARKRASREEFLHTLDALQADGRQLVLTCDCHPRLADDFPPELTDRLLGGAVWGLQPPDSDTRLAILRAKAGAPLFPDAVLTFLAQQLRGNVRELEGALNGVRHFARVVGRPIDVALAREALADLLRHAVRVVQLADVDRAVCGALRLETGTLQSRARAWAVSHPRMVAMYLARKHTAASYAEIGGHFGGRNHSTVVAAEKKVRTWLDADAELALGERKARVREVVERAERELLH
jgi:chromosomal replication initiator protein